MSHKASALVVLLSLSFCDSSSHGIVRSWDGGAGSSNWISGNNWNPNGVPASGDDVAIGAMAVANDETVLFGLFPPFFDMVRSLELSNGADLDLNDGQLTVSGSIDIGGGFSGNTLSELFVTPVEGMDVDAVVAVTMTINLNGRLTMNGGSVTVGDGNPLAPGTFNLNSGGIFGYGTIQLVPAIGNTIMNNDGGSIVVGTPNEAVLGEPAARTLTITGATINLDATLHNDSEVVIRRNSTLDLDADHASNYRGELRLFGNSTLDLGNAFEMATSNGDNATLIIDSGATSGFFPLPAAPAVIRGERFTLGNNARITLNSADDELRVDAEFHSTAGNISNAGEVHFAGISAFGNATNLDSIGNGRVFNDPTGHMVLGIGIDFAAPLTNEGRLQVGGPTVEGEVQIESFIQTGTGILDAKLSNVIPGDFDHFAIEGNALLAGTLNVVLLNDFEPILGNTFEILSTTFGNISGEFSEVVVPVFNDLTFEVLYNPDSVVLQVVEYLAGDFDEDGDVDGRDFLIWQRGESPDPLSAGDLADWQENYGVGSLVSTVAVPEPQSWRLFVGVGAFIIFKRNRPCMPAANKNLQL